MTGLTVYYLGSQGPYRISIMHDTCIVIGYAIGVDLLGGIMLEVVVHAGDDVVLQNADIIITIGSGLLVLEPHCMTQLMHDSFLL